MNPRPAAAAGPPLAATPPVYDAGAALDAYASCARYAVSANGAGRAAPGRQGRRRTRAAARSSATPIYWPWWTRSATRRPSRALDLTRVDGRVTCRARALSHALAAADRGRGLAYLALVGAPLGLRGAERLATAATLNPRCVQGCDARDAGLDAFAQALGERLPQLERLDVAGTARRSTRASGSKAARRAARTVESVASSCGATASRSKWPARRRTRRGWRPSRRGPYLLHEAKRSGLTARARCRLRVGPRFYFAVSAETTSRRRARPGAAGARRRRGAAGSRWDRAAPALVLAATHGPSPPSSSSTPRLLASPRRGLAPCAVVWVESRRRRPRPAFIARRQVRARRDAGPPLRGQLRRVGDGPPLRARRDAASGRRGGRAGSRRRRSATSPRARATPPRARHADGRGGSHGRARSLVWRPALRAARRGRPGRPPVSVPTTPYRGRARYTPSDFQRPECPHSCPSAAVPFEPRGAAFRPRLRPARGLGLLLLRPAPPARPLGLGDARLPPSFAGPSSVAAS